MSPNGMDDPATPYPLIERIRTGVTDPRAWAVMEAAFAVFLQFGVRRASMQDIADRAGMSRAALYLHYRNKSDIFGALVAAYLDAAADAVEAALAAHDDPADALIAAFAAQVGDAAEAMMQSPHAEELLSAKQGAVAEVQAEGHARLVSVYAAWLARSVAAGRIHAAAVGPDTRAAAVMLMAALDGLKAAPFDLGGYRNARVRLARLLGRGLAR
jgi:AcrR family transcriptional regulator